MTREHERLESEDRHGVPWRRWGPYLSERAWGTVREDYSPYGTAWDYFTHDHARSRAYRWNEDGLAGISDRHGDLCFALALWNEHDPILKERLFGLSGQEGNHGEDVKELYYYLDCTPTHSYMRMLYKYPQGTFPYVRLVAENRRRGREAPEFELMDTGALDEDRYFDVFVEYAKADVQDILIRITAHNRGPEAAPLHLLPTLWLRNTWSWEPGKPRPRISGVPHQGAPAVVAEHPRYGPMWLLAEETTILFTENETNAERLWGTPNPVPYVKDAFHDAIVRGLAEAGDLQGPGSKAAYHAACHIAPGQAATLRLRLTTAPPADWLNGFDEIIEERHQEANEFYDAIAPPAAGEDAREVMRQALAGLLWSKQFYHYEVQRWLDGDPAQPPAPPDRRQGRNSRWLHLYNAEVISMPDKWEYPWYAAWDLGFHCVSLALVDPRFAKEQLILLLREWYMRPDGQLPAYEWALGDVNPPVHAWAALHVYHTDAARTGRPDVDFLERVFHKLLLNFTWWVNRKDTEENNLFEGGFLGLDNIGVFDRSAPLPTGGSLEQSDGTAWMAMYCLNLLAIAVELAQHDRSYEDVASKFWEHFVFIDHAMNNRGPDGIAMWHEEDGFYYDVLNLPDRHPSLRIRSMVGLIPLFAVYSFEPHLIEPLVGFRRRRDWFLENRPEYARDIASLRKPGQHERRLLALVVPSRLRRVLGYMLDENEFLSPYGVRSLSRYHLDHPYEFDVDSQAYRVAYEPAESHTALFGGNSNWRGPVWFPLNVLIIEALRRFHHYLGDSFKVECPTGSGRLMNLGQVAREIAHRLTRIFLRNDAGRRPVFGGNDKLHTDPHFRDYLLFHEYFHGDDGAGLGASHQTGWTALVANLLKDFPSS